VSFSYQPGGATDLDDIRAALGDTEATAPTGERLENEEISRFLTLRGSKAAATVDSARALIAKLSRRATEKSTASMRVVYSQRIESLWKLVRDLERDAAGAAVPFVGGISVSDVDAVESETDRVAPAFKRGMLDNPRTT
jgi:hypothetical protein